MQSGTFYFQPRKRRLRFMPISHELIVNARQTDLVEYLIAEGYEMKHEGGQNFRICGKPGLIVQGNHWYNHVNEQRGNAIDFLIKIEGFGFKEAVERLIGIGKSGFTQRHHPTVQVDYITFKLPRPAKNNQLLIQYLANHRRIPVSIIKKVIVTAAA